MEAARCPGCGIEAAGGGPVHAYIGASPGCWALYGEVLAREYGELDYPEVHGLTVDAYAVQHPGRPGPRQTRSVCVHLIGLCLALERGTDQATTVSLRTRVADAVRSEFRWLEPPGDRGGVTVRDVLGASGGAAHADAVRRWAASVWEAWSGHHPLIHDWIARAG